MSYERLETRKGCHAKLCEKADPLKALGGVASYLRNGKFYLINDTKAGAEIGSTRMRVLQVARVGMHGGNRIAEIGSTRMRVLQVSELDTRTVTLDTLKLVRP